MEERKEREKNEEGGGWWIVYERYEGIIFFLISVPGLLVVKYRVRDFLSGYLSFCLFVFKSLCLRLPALFVALSLSVFLSV